MGTRDGLGCTVIATTGLLPISFQNKYLRGPVRRRRGADPRRDQSWARGDPGIRSSPIPLSTIPAARHLCYPAFPAARNRRQASLMPSASRTSKTFLLLTVFTWAQIAFGALVRAKQAGLSCPDWPLCHGALVPNLKLTGVVYEYGHRLLAAVVSALYLLGAWLGWRDPQLRESCGATERRTG